MKLENARVLLTGGAGFIGSATLWALNRRGCSRVVVVDVMGTSEKWRNLSPLRYEDYVEASDLFSRLRSNSLGRFDLVLHLGAESSTTVTDVAYLLRNNYEYTKDLAHWALDHGARFVYASSAATYGNGSQGMDDRTEAIEQFQPLNPYGYSKQLFDVYAKTSGILNRIVGLKYFNVFGPNENHKGDMRSVVAKAYEQVRDTERIRLFKSYKPDYKDGEQKRDFLYVKDAVEMTLHLAETASAAGLYNLGSGGAHTWLDLANAVFAAMKVPPAIDFIDMPEALRGQYQYFTEANISKLRATGFTSDLTPLNDAVADYVKNYLARDTRLSIGT